MIHLVCSRSPWVVDAEDLTEDSVARACGRGRQRDARNAQMKHHWMRSGTSTHTHTILSLVNIESLCMVTHTDHQKEPRFKKTRDIEISMKTEET